MHREVYYALNLPMGTVKTHLHRAKRSPPALLDVIGSDPGAVGLAADDHEGGHRRRVRAVRPETRPPRFFHDLLRDEVMLVEHVTAARTMHQLHEVVGLPGTVGARESGRRRRDAKVTAIQRTGSRQKVDGDASARLQVRPQTRKQGDPPSRPRHVAVVMRREITESNKPGSHVLGLLFDAVEPR